MSVAIMRDLQFKELNPKGYLPVRQTKEAVIYCPLCQETHVNNSQCQRND